MKYIFTRQSEKWVCRSSKTQAVVAEVYREERVHIALYFLYYYLYSRYKKYKTNFQKKQYVVLP